MPAARARLRAVLNARIVALLRASSTCGVQPRRPRRLVRRCSWSAPSSAALQPRQPRPSGSPAGRTSKGSLGSTSTSQHRASGLTRLRSRMTRMLVTGGGGFLGSHLVERLERDGHDVVAARRRDYDLTSMDDTRSLFDDAAPELVFHLAAEVGGIGANRANPGRYWYANLIMGAHVLEQSRLHETPKLVVAGTICAYPKHARAVPRGRPLGRLPGGDERSLRHSEEGDARGRARPTGTSTARTRSSCSRRTSTGHATTSTSRRSHVIPALIRKMIESPGRGRALGRRSPTREFLFVDDCVEGLVLAAERYDGADPVNLGTGEETRSESSRSRRRRDRVRGRDRLGHVEAERPAAPAARHHACRRAVRLPRPRPLREGSSARWPGTAPPLRRMPLADRVRTAGTRTGPLLAGASRPPVALDALRGDLRIESRRLALRAEHGLRSPGVKGGRSGWSTATCRAKRAGSSLADCDLAVRECCGYPRRGSRRCRAAQRARAGSARARLRVLDRRADRREAPRSLDARPLAAQDRGCCSSVALEPYDPGHPRPRAAARPRFDRGAGVPGLPSRSSRSAALISTSFDRRFAGWEPLSRGLLAGAAVAIEPHSLLFLGGAAGGAYVASRRIPEAGVFALGELVPAVLAVGFVDCSRRSTGDGPALLRPCGLGSVHREHGRVAQKSSGASVYCSGFHSAGTIAVARRSIPLALLLGGWMISFGVDPRLAAPSGVGRRGHFPGSSSRSASLRRACGCDSVALHPTLTARLGTRLDPLLPTWSPGTYVLAVTTVVLALVPLATAAFGSS